MWRYSALEGGPKAVSFILKCCLLIHWLTGQWVLSVSDTGDITAFWGTNTRDACNEVLNTCGEKCVTFCIQSVWHRQYGGVGAFPQALVCRGCRTARVYKRLTASSCIPGPEPQVLAKALAALSPWLSGRAGVGGNLEWGDGAPLQPNCSHWTLEPTCSLPAKSGQCKLPFPAWDFGCLWGREMILMWRQRRIVLVLKFSHAKLRKSKRKGV